MAESEEQAGHHGEQSHGNITETHRPHRGRSAHEYRLRYLFRERFFVSMFFTFFFASVFVFDRKQKQLNHPTFR
jgi:hypothetical protein